MKKICPKCGKEHTQLENYCRKCGIELEKEPNMCSEKKSAMCMKRIFADDDLYCSYCGAPTVYALNNLTHE